MFKLSTQLVNYLMDTGSFKAAMADGKIFYFSGEEPASADDALDMVSTHTQLVAITDNGGGSGLDLAASAVAGVIGKDGGQTWKGDAAFDGFDEVTTPQTAVFFRFCAAGDDGRGASAAGDYRVQGTIGLVGSLADLQVTSVSITSSQTNITIAAAGFRLPLFLGA